MGEMIVKEKLDCFNVGERLLVSPDVVLNFCRDFLTRIEAAPDCKYIP